MSLVYEQASRVIVWLGDCNEPAVGPLSGLDSRRARPDNLDLWRREDHQLRSLMAAICSTKSKWWDRAWVVQEVVVAKIDPVIAFGPYSLPIRNVEALLATLVNDAENSISDGLLEVYKKCDQLKDQRQMPVEPFRLLWLFTKQFERIKTLRNLRNRGMATLYNATALTSGLAANDDRDRLFSLLGIVNAAEANLIEIDYNATPDVIFHSVPRKVLGAIQDLYLLILVRNLGHFSQTQASNIKERKPPASWTLSFASDLTVYFSFEKDLRPRFDTQNTWTKPRKQEYWQSVHISDVGADIEHTAGRRLHGIVLGRVLAKCYQVTDLEGECHRPNSEIEWQGAVLLDELRSLLKGARWTSHFYDMTGTWTPRSEAESTVLSSLEDIADSSAVFAEWDNGDSRRESKLIQSQRRTGQYDPASGSPGPQEADVETLLHCLLDLSPLNDENTRVTEVAQAFEDWNCYRRFASDCVVAFCTARGELGLGLGGVEVGDLIILTDSDAPGAMAVRAHNDGYFFKGFVLMEATLCTPLEHYRKISFTFA